jgi:hypothetical protein
VFVRHIGPFAWLGYCFAPNKKAPDCPGVKRLAIQGFNFFMGLAGSSGRRLFIYVN